MEEVGGSWSSNFLDALGNQVQIKRKEFRCGEHIPMLNNPEANARADAAALEQARKIGLTREEIELLGIGGPFDPDTLKDEG